MATEKVRRQIASAAARLLFDRQEDELHRAKQRAARQLGHGWVKPDDLPTNREVRAELQVWAASRAPDSNEEHLRLLRHSALAVMRQLRAFRPRLAGDALSGRWTEGSRIEIQLVTDNVAAVIAALRAEPAVHDAVCEHIPEQVHERTASQWQISFRLEPGRWPVSIRINDVRTARRTAARAAAARTSLRASISDVEALLRRSDDGQPDGELLPPAATAAVDRLALFAALLAPLEQVKQSPQRHPEGDALYHSLQVFELARNQLPYDEEFLTAALLHDVGKALDPREHVAAGLEALGDSITPRTAWLIEHHGEGQQLRDGTLGARSVRRLAAHPDYDELMLLVQCDREGRRRGMRVPDVEEALEYLRELAEACDE